MSIEDLKIAVNAHLDNMARLCEKAPCFADAYKAEALEEIQCLIEGYSQ